MTSPKNHTIDEVRILLHEYEQFLAGKAQGTKEVYLRTVRDLIGWVSQLPGNEGQFQPSQLTQTAVECYLTHLEREGLSINHRARVKSTISNFAQFLIEEKGLLQRNPTRGIDLSPMVQAPRALSHEQRSLLHALIAQAGDQRGVAIFALGYWAGCRVSEISWLQMAHTHISPTKGWLHVGHDGRKWRDIDLLNQAREPLYAYLRATRGIQRTYVFVSQRSERLTEQGVYAWFRSLKAQATKEQWEVIAELTFHDLRYDFAQRAREAGWSAEEVAYYLGDVGGQGMPAIHSALRSTPITREHIQAKLNDIKG